MSTNLVQSSAKTPTRARLVKLITFSIGKLNLAMRIEQVAKVVNIPAVYGSGLNAVGLAQVDNQEVTVVDLHRKLFRTDAAPATSYYLVLVKTRAGELLGIPAHQTPLLMEVPTALIRSLPESYRRSDTLEIASHIVVLPAVQGAAELQASCTLFLLDLEMLAQ